MERPGSPEERETDMADWVDINSPRFVAKQFILMADEIDRLREAVASMDCTCIGPVPTGDDPALYRCTRCAALRGEEG